MATRALRTRAATILPGEKSSVAPDYIAWAVWLLAALGLVLLVVPIVNLLFGSLISDVDGRLSAANYLAVVGFRRFGTVVLNTIILGIGSVAVMMAVAIPLAWLYARTDFRWKRTLLVAVTAQIATPGFLVALGYVFLLNRTNGLVNEWWRWATGAAEPLVDVYSMGWIVLLQGISLAGPAFYFLAPALSAIDGALEEAAAVHGVGRMRTMLCVLLPVARPALLGTAIFFLMVSVEIFDFAGMLGLPARIDVLATWIYQFTQSATGGPEYGQAAAVGVIAGLPLLALLLAKTYLTRDAERLATLGGRRRPAAVLLGRSGQIVAALSLAAFLVICFVLPIGMLLWTSLLPFPQAPSRAALALLSLDGYGSPFWQELASVGRTTAILVLLVPSLVVVLSVCLSWVGQRLRKSLAQLLEAALLGSLAIPSIVLAVAFAAVALRINRIVPLYGTLILLATAIAARFLATANRITAGAVEQVKTELLEACRVTGISSGRVFISIVLPLLRPSLVFAWFWVALLVLRELPITLILGGGDLQTLASRIFAYNASGEVRQASSLAVALLAIVAAMLAVFVRIALGRLRNARAG